MRQALLAAGVLGVFLVGCCGGVVTARLWQVANMWGEGSVPRANLWRGRLQEFGDPEAAHKAYPEVVSKRFGNGEWVFGVSEHSYMNPQGGTIVVKDIRGRVRAFFGQVADMDYLGDLLRHAESLDSLYEMLGRFHCGEYLFPPNN